MTDNVKTDVNLKDFINIFKINKILIPIFIGLCLLALILNFYYFNKKYSINLKFLAIDNKNFSIIENANQTVKRFPHEIKSYFIFDDWDYDKFHRYYELLINRKSFSEKVLNELEHEDKDKIIIEFNNMNIINDGKFFYYKTDSKYPEVILDIIFKINQEIASHIQNQLSENYQTVSEVKEAHIGRLNMQLKDNHEKLIINIKKTLEIKLIMLKNQIDLGLVNKNSSFEDPMSINLFNLIFPTFLIENLNEFQIKEQIVFYENLLKKNQFFAIDNSNYLHHECIDCEKEIINDVFKDYQIKVVDVLKNIKFTNLSIDKFKYSFVSPWNFDTLYKYIFLPFILFYFILLIRYIYFQKLNDKIL